MGAATMNSPTLVALPQFYLQSTNISTEHQDASRTIYLMLRTSPSITTFRIVLSIAPRHHQISDWMIAKGWYVLPSILSPFFRDIRVRMSASPEPHKPTREDVGRTQGIKVQRRGSRSRSSESEFWGNGVKSLACMRVTVVTMIGFFAGEGAVEYAAAATKFQVQVQARAVQVP